MTLKSFSVAAIAGTIVYFILGGIFYGAIFPNMYPPQEGHEQNMMFIVLGGLFYSMFMTLVIGNTPGKTELKSSAMYGALIAGLIEISMQFYMNSAKDACIVTALQAIFTSVVCGCVLAIVIGVVLKKTNK